jgi:hypothetical protein
MTRRTIRGTAAALMVALAAAACQTPEGGYPPPGPRFGSDDGTR